MNGFLFERRSRKLTQTDVAQALGVDQSTVSCWESGKAQPRGAMLLRVAALYGCTVDQLLKPPAGAEYPEQLAFAGAEIPEGGNSAVS